ncbi:uncharacterized protein LOC128989236 [Macrosteles quadrilineatus]|uniref:uncharacterized protein LOC128989236 n=1 Tax=Macrosteles quadrilineatus TaxID=74068 RepID=UPI0023E09396|nr:uncharacterized protein LOC128989236 [Macrosteles quadrilineatus]
MGCCLLANHTTTSTTSTLQETAIFDLLFNTNHVNFEREASSSTASAITACISTKDLKNKDGYTIVDAKRVETRFGITIVCEIVMPDQSHAVTYLPSRFHHELCNEDFVQLKSSGYKLRTTGMSWQGCRPSYLQGVKHNVLES